MYPGLQLRLWQEHSTSVTRLADSSSTSTLNLFIAARNVQLLLRDGIMFSSSAVRAQNAGAL